MFNDKINEFPDVNCHAGGYNYILVIEIRII